MIHETLVDLLAIQREIHAGIFTVMDGTLIGSGPGPRTMIPIERDYMLASGDSVAIDAVSARLMGFDPFSIGYIRLAHERGLGKGAPEEIEVVGYRMDCDGVNVSIEDEDGHICFHTSQAMAVEVDKKYWKRVE